MSVSVVDLLARGRAASPEVSALDAVMGEDWAEIGPGRPRKAALGLALAHREDVKRHRGIGAPGALSQAVVKMIRKGGVSDVGGLRAQMAYLAREGEVPLQRSERYMGAEVNAEGMVALERSWRLPGEGSGVADRTSHFLVSFPEETAHRAAERAGRAWAEELFASGDYGGDAFDYYTAFHTDRSHPHMHVVVHRRGLDHGAWLKVSKRSDLNYDAMRAVLVEVAGREGIVLEATPRLARGVHDRPVPDAELRRATAERREPEAPAHTTDSAVRAAAALIHFARRFASDARRLEREAPEQAALLRVASEHVAHGIALNSATLDPGQVRQVGRSGQTRQEGRGGHPGQEDDMSSARVEARREEVRENFEKLDRGVGEMEDGAGRMRALRQVAELKARSAPLMAEPGALRAFRETDDSGRYRGVDGSDGRNAVIKAEADERVRAIAGRYGLDGEATVERHSGGVPSRGLAAEYARAEERERGRSRAEQGRGPEAVEDRRAALDRMHGEVGRVYAEARARAAPVEERDVGRAVPRPGEPGREDASAAPTEGGSTPSGPSEDREAARARWVAERRAAERRDAEIARAEKARKGDEGAERAAEIERRHDRDRDDGHGR